jgi:hypothetical protein
MGRDCRRRCDPDPRDDDDRRHCCYFRFRLRHEGDNLNSCDVTDMP